MAMAAAAAGRGGGGGGGKLPPPNPNLPYREDCWSDGETAALVSAWGTRYIDLNRGNLRQKQWQEVADAVNSRRGASRAAARRAHRRPVQEPRRHAQEEVQGRARAQRALRLVLLPRARPTRRTHPQRLRLQEALAVGGPAIRPARPPPAHNKEASLSLAVAAVPAAAYGGKASPNGFAAAQLPSRLSATFCCPHPARGCGGGSRDVC
ncbi:hypothetical protein PR202_gb02100 [Eleusine coracana subsp. coracana]|uniref:Myb/SANT-like DNA-binding domain-containing protein n=1 Tax=Eleusine coracana subsp. coracana TaxID=191504 RepID=A0AAV5DY60_ELECO|nr:hypothetical protein PR202_gb02100 [Eleusine coracana subsp. coracana]